MNYSLPQSLDPHRWPFGLEWLPEAAHLVGGSVRDGLLGRRSSHLDLDFVLPHHAVNTARAIAQHYGTGFVVLDAEHQIARIVFDSVTADFADQVGHSLNDDLHRRDFTINAIAYHPKTETVVDPLSGRLDLEQKTIRMISRDNLVEDPLRLLRAYRQAAQLDFWIEPATQDAIEDLAALLKHVAPERVYSELSYLLSHPKGTEMLIRAWKSHLLQVWLPHIQWESLKRVEAVDEAIAQVISRWHVMGDLLKGWPRDQQHAVGGGRSWLKVAKLTCLLHDHPAVAEDELWQLKCSRLEVQSVLTILRHRELIKSGAIATLSRRDLYFLFQDVGDVFPAVAVLAIAGGVSLQAITPLIERFLNPSDPVAHPHPLVTGRDIMAHLHLSPGPQIGKLLSQIQIAQAEGSILTSEDALNLAQTLVSSPSP